MWWLHLYQPVVRSESHILRHTLCIRVVLPREVLGSFFVSSYAAPFFGNVISQISISPMVIGAWDTFLRPIYDVMLCYSNFDLKPVLSLFGCNRLPWLP